jgi:hypothetical protein
MYAEKCIQSQYFAFGHLPRNHQADPCRRRYRQMNLKIFIDFPIIINNSVTEADGNKQKVAFNVQASAFRKKYLRQF